MLSRTTPPELFCLMMLPDKKHSALLAEQFALVLQSYIQGNKDGKDQNNALMMLENGSVELNWEKYEVYLRQNFNAKTFIDRLSYARRYHELLLNKDLSTITQLSDDKRLHIMKALATLSKFLGCYKTWLELREQFGLKWGNPNDSLNAFKAITGEDESNIDEMEAWVIKAKSAMPEKYAAVLDYNLLTGLRPSEAIISISLLNQEPEKYRKGMLLQHWRYPALFLRRTKKAYVSIVTDSLLSLAQKHDKRLTYQAIQCKLRRVGMDCKLEYCRQIFATKLKQNGIEQEIIDLLQGRLPQNVFLRHYYRPNFKKEIEKIKTILDR